MKRIAANLAAAFSIGFSAVAISAPVSPTVLYGAADIQASTSGIDITLQSPAVILGWQSFSIDTSETVRVFGPQTWGLLNRVGGGASSLLGSIEASGNFGLVNLAGIIAGDGFSVLGRDLLFSAVNVADADFVAQAAGFTGFTYDWLGATGALSLGGTFNGRSIFLAGSPIDATGTATINATNLVDLQGAGCAGCPPPQSGGPVGGGGTIAIGGGGTISVVPLPAPLLLFLSGLVALLGIRLGLARSRDTVAMRFPRSSTLSPK